MRRTSKPAATRRVYAEYWVEQDQPTESVDGYLCSWLCKRARGLPVLWETATISRKYAGYDMDKVIMTAEAVDDPARAQAMRRSWMFR